MDNPQRKQCGKPECKRAFNTDRMRDWNRRHCAKTGQWYHRNYAEQHREYSRRRYQEQPHWRVLHPERAALIDARRRMRMLEAQTSEVFAPLDVHTRDGWTCQLCCEPIDQAIAWPHPKSPSVDHIIPLSRGGAHALSNVQSAHLGCNSSKCDKGMVDAVLALAGQAAPR
ncbi:HNH endonuclease [Streptomyces prasinus]|uniref:HNH endonuclease n=1 Tax=Streptomyces prasinus TaxID=67345 RepID=UPI00332A3525